MKIEFTKLTDQTHLLAITRVDGSHESVTCESKSYLRHDLIHFALESEAGLSFGFWGLIASGKSLQATGSQIHNELKNNPKVRAIEGIIGILQSSDLENMKSATSTKNVENFVFFGKINVLT